MGFIQENTPKDSSVSRELKRGLLWVDLSNAGVAVAGVVFVDRDPI